ncbi:5-dehydro-4-deoxy-D-glucuronate isomerase [Bacillus horti]|uniref:4-deoxy-L-threo-5-hexosulose-uronate ketol-isomerase n=1 Tax=Caldalkalibacillus horti TaxID=77523 RepID=A0ABT9VW23_9BACI|nr:5-dehydro-4-deoxy-D-glucuronate isomerase [Bacillus horti]MDQ0165202.1 4-deoxy-L-threo-5-hexosulose-uronate ketol-isomerase [Bacillus horti]
MENRYATNPQEAKHYTTEKLREEYLIELLFEDNKLHLTYSHEDRVVIGGAVPKDKVLKLDAGNFLKTAYFLERREIGIVNIGGNGVIMVGDMTYVLSTKEALYIGKGNKEVLFESRDIANPAKFYLVSTTAHQSYPTVKVSLDEAQPVHLGSDAESNKRTIYKYIHADGAKSCQLMLGMTILAPNNMWNTMPAHLHDRRMEVYLYFDLTEAGRVFHFMGQPHETRHLVVKNEQAMISPPWSIHSGVGTSNYTFIWAMAGENDSFADMEPVAMETLK